MVSWRQQSQTILLYFQIPIHMCQEKGGKTMKSLFNEHSALLRKVKMALQMNSNGDSPYDGWGCLMSQNIIFRAINLSWWKENVKTNLHTNKHERKTACFFLAFTTPTKKEMGSDQPHSWTSEQSFSGRQHHERKPSHTNNEETGQPAIRLLQTSIITK